MNGTNRGAIRAYAAFSNDLIDLIVKDYPLDLFEDPFPILEAQPDPVWAGHPVWSRNAVKLMSALLPVVEGRFDCNPYVHGSPPYKELTLAQARSPTTTPMFCPLPRVPELRALPQSVWRRGSILALNSSGPARPYMARLRVFRRLI